MRVREIENPRDEDAPVRDGKGAGRRVFVTNLAYHDYGPLSRWGEIVPVTKGRLNIKNTDRLEGEIQELLENHQIQEDDYVCISGLAYIAVLVVGYWFAKFGKVNILYWDALLQDYHLRVHTFERKEIPE